MERFEWFYYELLKQVANVKSVILSFFKKIPLLGNLSDQTLQWIVIGIVFAVLAVVMFPLLKWSIKIGVAAAAIAAILAFITSSSFWGVLPFAGLGVAIVVFSNKFQTE